MGTKPLNPKSYIIYSRLGFTIVELLVIMAIAVLIFIFTLGVGSDFYRNQSLISERDTVINLLRRARTKAMNNENQSNQGLSVSTTSYVLFSGDSYALRNASYDEEFPRSGIINVSGPTEAVFAALEGTSNVSGTISVSNSKDTANISVNYGGRITW